MRMQMYMLHQIYVYTASYVYSYVYSVSKLSEVAPMSERLKTAKKQIVSQAMDIMGGMHKFNVHMCTYTCIYTFI
jgi:hypothetical protein